MGNKPTRRCDFGREDSAAAIIVATRIIFRAFAPTSSSISRDKRRSFGYGAHLCNPGVHHRSEYFPVCRSLLIVLDMARGMVFCGGLITPSACSILFDCFVETCMIPNSAPGNNTSTELACARIISAFLLVHSNE
jgi:hypothetical protein